jgi:hypothetical protein
LVILVILVIVRMGNCIDVVFCSSQATLWV